MEIMGTKFLAHDSSVCIINPDKKDIFAINTERVTRIKHDYMPISPILEFLKKRKYDLSKIEYVVQPFSNFNNEDDGAETKANSLNSMMCWTMIYEVFRPKYRKDLENLKKRLLLNVMRRSPEFLKRYGFDFFRYFGSYAINRALLKITKPSPKKNEENIRKLMTIIMSKYGMHPKISFKEHHLSHAASAYYFSPFNTEKAFVFTLDGQGDGTHSSLWEFDGLKRKAIGYSKIPFRNNMRSSIGDIYSSFTEALGFIQNSDEGKTEALAAYGKPNKELYEELRKTFFVDKEKMIFQYNEDVALKFKSVTFSKKWVEKVGRENAAATVQRWLEDLVVEYLLTAKKKYGFTRLALAGGVVANVILNLNIFERVGVDELYIVPAMGDAGSACGAAVLQALDLGEDIFWLSKKEMPYYGPQWSKKDVEEELKKWTDIEYKHLGEEWPEKAAEMVADSKIVAIYQGKMEFGPRALGNRSILADPRKKETRDRINSTVKRRPWFQPFCPSILESERKRLFEKSYKHKHMAIAFRFKKKFWDELPSAMHIDGTGRPQFVEKKDNEAYYRILKKMKELTGYGVVVNTSFNLHGRTIVMTPADALRDFIDCNIDVLFIEGYEVKRKIKKNKNN